MKVTNRLLPIIGNGVILIFTWLIFSSTRADDWDWDWVVSLKGYWH